MTTDRKRGASRHVSSAVRIYAETNKIALYASAVKVLLLVVCALGSSLTTNESGEILKKLNAVAIDFTAK